VLVRRILIAGAVLLAQPLAAQADLPDSVWVRLRQEMHTYRDSILPVETLTQQMLVGADRFRFRLSEADAREWAGYFVHYGRVTNVEPRLLAAIAMQESAWNPRARSHVGATGLMQVMPRPWRNGFVRECGGQATPTSMRNPRLNICYGAHIFAFFRGAAGGDMYRSLRGYNSGFRFIRNGYDHHVMRRYAALARS
jgi:soluble lytic murein transglycosylase-like protein